MADLVLPHTPNAKALAAADEVYHRLLRQYGYNMDDGGRTQMLVEAWRVMLAAHGVTTCPESGKHCKPVDGECQTCGAVVAAQPAVPEGYVLVPIKPTPAMKEVMLDWGTKRSEWEMILRAAQATDGVNPCDGGQSNG